MILSGGIITLILPLTLVTCMLGAVISQYC